MASTSVENNTASCSLKQQPMSAPTTTMDTNRKTYQLPENYNPSDYGPVKLRNSNADRSETQRKRRSKNRLSNRRSTGFVPKDTVDEAIKLGAETND